MEFDGTRQFFLSLRDRSCNNHIFSPIAHWLHSDLAFAHDKLCDTCRLEVVVEEEKKLMAHDNPLFLWSSFILIDLQSSYIFSNEDTNCIVV